MTLTAVSVFSGIGGLDLVFHRLGWKFQAMVENAPHPRTILARHFAGVPLLGDISLVHVDELGPVPTLFVGGFPCKDTSIAAPHRAGLAGDRSGLFWHQVRLIHEWQQRDGAGPEWVVIENPDGALASNEGRDWLAVTGALAELGYGWAYRIVDGTSTGVLQARPRAILVAHRSGDATRAGRVLGLVGDGGIHGPASRVESNDRPGARPPIAEADAGACPDGTLIFRKSAKARASLDKGGYETWVPAEKANTLTTFDQGGPKRQTHLVVRPDGRIRTLTPLEWERLSGFPDGWTEGIPDGARFTALGNCVHVATGEWIAQALTGEIARHERESATLTA